MLHEYKLQHDWNDVTLWYTMQRMHLWLKYCLRHAFLIEIWISKITLAQEVHFLDSVNQDYWSSQFFVLCQQEHVQNHDACAFRPALAKFFFLLSGLLHHLQFSRGVFLKTKFRNSSFLCSSLWIYKWYLPRVLDR